MSEGNGEPIIMIGRKGMATFQFEGGKPFKIDVVHISNQWMEIDREYRDEKGHVPADKYPAMNAAAAKFVTEVSGQDNLTLTEVLEFLKCLTEESQKLRRFFDPAISDAPSSPGRSELTFLE